MTPTERYHQRLKDAADWCSRDFEEINPGEIRDLTRLCVAAAKDVGDLSIYEAVTESSMLDEVLTAITSHWFIVDVKPAIDYLRPRVKRDFMEVNKIEEGPIGG